MEGLIFYQEIFSSIQGEGVDAGKPCTFVRLFGCNMKCSYCDQPQKPEEKIRTSVKKIVSQVIKLGVPNVCITGGEPLIQWDSVYPLVLELTNLAFNVSIETNGCCPIEKDNYKRSYKYIMDVKCPSSGMKRYNILENLMNLQSKDEVVFVIKDKKDYNFAKSIIMSYPTSAVINMSPCFEGNTPSKGSRKLVDWILEDRMYNVRVSVQIHKFLQVK